MSKIILASALTALIVVSADAATTTNLRAADNGQRNLQLAANLLNSLQNVFTPLIREYLVDELSYYDPLEFGNETKIDLGNSTFDGACPMSSANLTYGIGGISGISNINIKSLELVPGSEDITVSFLALDGATWEGDWIFEFNWPLVTAASEIRLEANLCGFPVDQTVTGAVDVTNVDVVARATMEGATGNVLRFRPTSEVTAIVVDSVQLDIGNVTADFGIGGSPLQQLSVAETLQQKVLTDFANDIEPFIVNVVNSYFETNAPFPLAEDASSVSRGSP